jgi:vancomycin permeability regulator SanA
MKKTARYGMKLLLGWFLLHTCCIVADGLVDEREKADVGVILGTTVNPDGTLSERLRKRLDKGVQLYRDSLIGLVVVSGGLGKEGFYEGTKMADYLRAQGVPGYKIIIDNAGITTAATARNFRRMNLKPGSVIVVSQYFHISRTKLAFRNEGYAHVKGIHADYFEARDLYSIIREFFGFYKYLLNLK